MYSATKQLLISLLFGGMISSSSDNNKFECNDKEWQSLPSATLSPGRRNSAFFVDECEITLIGGLNGSPPNFLPSVISLNTLDGDNAMWQNLGATADDMQEPWFPTTKAAFEINGEIYVTCEDHADGKIWNYDRETGNWQVINGDSLMPSPVEDCCAFGINGEIYVFGGQNSATSSNLVQIYNIESNSWRVGSPMRDGREDLGCVLVNNEFVYVMGGAQGETMLESVEKYNIGDDSWEYFENALNPARRGFSAIHLDGTNEILLIAGDTCVDPNCPYDGSDSNYLESIEVWNIDSDEIDSDLSGKYPNLVDGRGGISMAVIDNDKCFGSSSSSSDDDNDNDNDKDNDKDDEKRSVTLYAIGGENILDEPSYTGVETLCIEYKAK